MKAAKWVGDNRLFSDIAYYRVLINTYKYPYVLINQK